MRKRASLAEVERRMLDAHARGDRVRDLDYDEVTMLLDAALERVRTSTEHGSAQIRKLAGTLSSAPLPAPPERKLA